MGDSSRGTEFFHGTAYDIPVGDSIRPGTQVGHSFWGNTGHAGQKSKEHAFATTDEGTAWHFAHRAGQSMRDKHYLHPAEEPKASRVSVYKVKPNPAMKPGVYNDAHPGFRPMTGNLHEFVAPSFETYERVDTQPGHQGTFPSLNWAQFQHPQIHTATDVNHPMDVEIKGGHRAMEGTAAAGRQRREREGWNAETPEKQGVSPDQMDLLTGKTSKEMAAGWDDVSKYHSQMMANARPEPVNPIDRMFSRR